MNTQPVVVTTIALYFMLAATLHPVQSESLLDNLIIHNHPKPAKILCWILSVDTENDNQKSQAIIDTWAPRCDKFLVVKNGTQLGENDNILTLPLEHESRRNLWHKVVLAFSYIHQKYAAQYDWFMKADDDTYVRVETLRNFLAKHSPKRPIYFGHRFKKFVKQGYMSGGSGYVLSNAALHRLIELGFKQNLKQCQLETGSIEDLLMGRCLEAVQVEAGDTRDDKQRETFLPVGLRLYLNPNEAVPWLHRYSYYSRNSELSRRFISNEPISFHYINPSLMRIMDYLLYDVRRQS